MELRDKVILIVGATGGIGSEVSARFAQEGASLILVGRNRQKLASLAKQCGNASSYYPCDVTRVSEIKKLIGKIKKRVSILDAFIYTAGVGIYTTLRDTSEVDWQRSFIVNVTVPYFLTQLLTPLFERSSLGVVLALGSGAGVIPMSGRSMYCATKFALRGAMLSLAEEYEGRRPSFCLITLGSTLTGFGPKTVEEKKKEFAAGTAYFPVAWVAEKLTAIIKEDERKTEYVLYPGDHGFGSWKKP